MAGRVPARARLVVALFRHSRGRLGELRLEGTDEVIRVTALHPFWSEDRQMWVSAGELPTGERLRTLNGLVRVESYIDSQSEEPVYNLEVDGDHCYRVGKLNIVAHNVSVNGCENDPGKGSTKCDRKALNTALGGRRADYQAHRIIPCSMRKYSVIAEAESLGYDINGANNGIHLPTNDAEAISEDLAKHFGGPIPEYAFCVETHIKKLQDDYNNPDSGLTDCDICPRLKVIEDTIRQALRDHEIWIQKSDPHVAGATWKCP